MIRLVWFRAKASSEFALIEFRRAASREKKLHLGFPARSDTNRAVQPQDMVRGLTFPILGAEGLYYICYTKALISCTVTVPLTPHMQIAACHMTWLRCKSNISSKNIDGNVSGTITCKLKYLGECTSLAPINQLICDSTLTIEQWLISQSVL